MKYFPEQQVMKATDIRIQGLTMQRLSLCLCNVLCKHGNVVLTSIIYFTYLPYLFPIYLRGLLPWWQCGWIITLTTHLQLMLRLRMFAALPALPLYAFTGWSLGIQTTFKLHR